MRIRLPRFLSSKKLWTAIATTAVVIVNRKAGLGLSDQEIGMVAGTAAAYMIGQGFADGGAYQAGKKD